MKLKNNRIANKRINKSASITFVVIQGGFNEKNI